MNAQKAALTLALGLVSNLAQAADQHRILTVRNDQECYSGKKAPCAEPDMDPSDLVLRENSSGRISSLRVGGKIIPVSALFSDEGAVLASTQAMGRTYNIVTLRNLSFNAAKGGQVRMRVLRDERPLVGKSPWAWTLNIVRSGQSWQVQILENGAFRNISEITFYANYQNVITQGRVPVGVRSISTR